MVSLYEGRKQNKSKKIQIILLFKENCAFGPEINVQKNIPLGYDEELEGSKISLNIFCV